MSTKRNVIGLIAIVVIFILVYVAWYLINRYFGSNNVSPSPPMVQQCSQNSDCTNSPNTLCQNGACVANPCSNISSCDQINGNCGWCFDGYDSSTGYTGVAIPGNNTGPTSGTCNSYIGNSSYCQGAATCAGIKNCQCIEGGDSCVWCSNLSIAVYSSGTGDLPNYPPPNCGTLANAGGGSVSTCPTTNTPITCSPQQ